MAWLQIEWRLRIDRPNDYSDEPGLRFAIVTIDEGTVNVYGHATGVLVGTEIESARIGDVWSGTVRSSQLLPDEHAPFFALAVQAVEHVGSSAQERHLDDKAFRDSVELVCQEVVDTGGVPREMVVWAAASAPGMFRERPDNDEWIGAAAWVDLDYGRRLARNIEREHRYQTGESVSSDGPLDRQVMRFPYGDAVYELEWERRVIAGPLLEEPSQFSVRGWCNASWVR